MQGAGAYCSGLPHSLLHQNVGIVRTDLHLESAHSVLVTLLFLLSYIFVFTVKSYALPEQLVDLLATVQCCFLADLTRFSSKYVRLSATVKHQQQKSAITNRSHISMLHIGVNPAGDAGDVSPPIFWLVGTSMGMSPPIFGVAM